MDDQLPEIEPINPPQPPNQTLLKISNPNPNH